MKPNKAKSKIKITDTQAIDILLAKIDKEVQYAESLSKETNKTASPTEDIILDMQIPVLTIILKLSQEKRIALKLKVQETRIY